MKWEEILFLLTESICKHCCYMIHSSEEIKMMEADDFLTKNISVTEDTMTHKEKALDYFDRKFHCSQAVLAAYAEECGLTEEQALKLGACFGSGMRKGEVCGACTGGLMVLGALYGQYDKADAESRLVANEVNDKMMDGFAKVSGSYICNDLLKCDISTPEGIEYARVNNLFTEFCPVMVANAVDVVERIISERQETDK